MTLPATRQHVVLSAPALGRVTARVEDVAEDLLMLGLARALGDGQLAADGDEAAVEFLTRRGLHRVDGRVRGDTGEPDLVHFSPLGRVRLIQRRELARIEAFLPVTVVLGGPDATRLPRTTLDISGCGVRVGQLDGVAVGDTVWLCLELPDGDPPVEFWGRVARALGSGARGIVYEHVRDADRERIIAYVFDRQREALRLGRIP